MARLAWVNFAIVLCALAGCDASVGRRASCEAADGGHTDAEIPVDPVCPDACDDEAARAVVYDAAGRAMYAGQALITGSCAGGGNFCHSSSALDRYGVPAGLDFDAFPLALSANASSATDLSRLVRIQATIHRNRNAIWSTIVGGSMPPGNVGSTVVVNHHGWVSDPANVDSDVPLASLETPDGREILRNWLACGSPLVERWTTYLPADCSTNSECPSGLCTAGECEPAGDVVARIERPLDPSWRSIYAQVIEPNCNTPGCHAPDPNNGGLVSAELDLSTLEGGLAALIDVAASEDVAGAGAQCGGAGRIRVVPSEPDMSLFLDKLENEIPDCGDPMPFGLRLDATQLAVIREWITIGACLSDCSLPDTAMNANATCTAEVCGFTCVTGFADTDGDPANGCEATL